MKKEFLKKEIIKKDKKKDNIIKEKHKIKK